MLMQDARVTGNRWAWDAIPACESIAVAELRALYLEHPCPWSQRAIFLTAVGLISEAAWIARWTGGSGVRILLPDADADAGEVPRHTRFVEFHFSHDWNPPLALREELG